MKQRSNKEKRLNLDLGDKKTLKIGKNTLIVGLKNRFSASKYDIY